MKKILLATTALVFSAAAASAQVSAAISMGGEGRMGVIHTRNAAIPGSAAVQGVHTDDTAAAVGGGVAADDPVTAGHMTTLMDQATAAAAAVAAAQAALAAAVAAQDAAAIAAAEAALVAPQAALDAANANVAAASGTAAVAAVAAASTTVMEHRLQFNIAATVQADHGVTFGAATRVRIMAGNGGGFAGASVFVESNGVRLTFGNHDGAFRSAGASHGYLGGCYIGYVGGHLCGDTAGLIGRTQGRDSIGGGIPQLVSVRYTNGDITAMVSHERGGSTEVGIRGRFDAITVALGYSNRADARGTAAGSTVALSAHYNGGSWGVGAIVARLADTGAASVTNWSISGTAQVAGGTVAAYVGSVDNGLAGVSNTTWGAEYRYGLGGGASLVAGVERAARTTVASVGAVFNF